MIEQKHLDALSHQDGFKALLEEIHATRESLIQQMHDVSNDRLQQVSGRILQCDDILALLGWKK